MRAPVTTKPFLNSVNFCILQRVFLPFYLLIKEKIDQQLLSIKMGFTSTYPNVNVGVHTLALCPDTSKFKLPIPTCDTT